MVKRREEEYDSGSDPEQDFEDDEYEKELRVLQELTGKAKTQTAPEIQRNQALEIAAMLKTFPRNLPWIERVDVTSSKPVMIENVDDDLKREMAFYDQALEAVKIGKPKVISAGVPFNRPEDYFAEMIKSDDHMTRVRQKLVDEGQRIKRAEDAAKARMMKKYAKKVQVEKTQQKAMEKSATIDKIKLARKGKKNLDLGEDFGVSVDDDSKEKRRGGAGAGGKEKRGQSEKRRWRDEKYGFGGKKRGSKSNTAESTNAFGKGSTRTRTGLPAKSAGKSKVTKKRPGKDRRKSMKGKGK